MYVWTTLVKDISISRYNSTLKYIKCKPIVYFWNNPGSVNNCTGTPYVYKQLYNPEKAIFMCIRHVVRCAILFGICSREKLVLFYKIIRTLNYSFYWFYYCSYCWHYYLLYNWKLGQWGNSKVIPYVVFKSRLVGGGSL